MRADYEKYRCSEFEVAPTTNPVAPPSATTKPVVSTIATATTKPVVYSTTATARTTPPELCWDYSGDAGDLVIDLSCTNVANKRPTANMASISSVRRNILISGLSALPFELDLGFIVDVGGSIEVTRTNLLAIHLRKLRSVGA